MAAGAGGGGWHGERWAWAQARRTEVEARTRWKTEGLRGADPDPGSGCSSARRVWTSLKEEQEKLRDLGDLGTAAAILGVRRELSHDGGHMNGRRGEEREKARRRRRGVSLERERERE